MSVSTTAQMGEIEDTTDTAFEGRLDELALYNGSLNNNRIAAHATAANAFSATYAYNGDGLRSSKWDLTRKIDGKTVSRRLRKDQAALYEEWLANARQFDRTVVQLKAVSAKAAEVSSNRFDVQLDGSSEITRYPIRDVRKAESPQGRSPVH